METACLYYLSSFLILFNEVLHSTITVIKTLYLIFIEWRKYWLLVRRRFLFVIIITKHIACILIALILCMFTSEWLVSTPNLAFEVQTCEFSYHELIPKAAKMKRILSWKLHGGRGLRIIHVNETKSWQERIMGILSWSWWWWWWW